MQVTIKKGVPERLEDYVDVMRDSALWDHSYVPDESLLRDTLAEGLRDGTAVSYTHLCHNTPLLK